MIRSWRSSGEWRGRWRWIRGDGGDQLSGKDVSSTPT